MGLEYSIERAFKGVLTNPILSVLREIGMSRMLRRSNFVKRDVGYPAYQVLLHFLYMLLMNQRLSTFQKQSSEAFGKDVYYRFLRNPRYNWRRLLQLTTFALIRKIEPLQRAQDLRLLILDDTVEGKRGKRIEGCCKAVWSNKEQRTIRGINIVSLNYSDSYSTFQLDFAVRIHDSALVKVEDFTQKLHHRSHASLRREEGLEGKNTLGMQMVQRALKEGIDVDYLLVDSWYAKPDFFTRMQEWGVPTIGRIARNEAIWNFQGKRKSLEGIYRLGRSVKKEFRGHYGRIEYWAFDTVVTHKRLGKVKLVFLTTKENWIVLLSTDLALTAKRIIEIYRQRWNIEQGYKELREYFGLGREENRLFEALIGRITLSMLSYNLLSYLRRIENEPQTLGELFRDLECTLQALVISMEYFLQILQELAQVEAFVQRNKDLELLVDTLGDLVKKELGFMCES